MTGDLGARCDVRAQSTTEGALPADERTSLALAAMLLGEGTLADLRSCGLDCEVGDIARANEAMPELSIVPTPEGFRCELPAESLAEALPRLAERWSALALDVVRVLFGRGDHHRVAAILGGIMDAVDVRPLVFRHAFDLLNAGEAELVESLVFDEAFEAPEWLREALSCVEGLLWSGFCDYRQQVKRAREVQAMLVARVAKVRRPGDERVPMAQAWALLDLYASWGEPAPVESELPKDLVDEGDDLLRCLWTLRRCRQLMALGHLSGALRLIETVRRSVGADSILGAHLALDRFLCRMLTGEPVDEGELRRVRDASRFAMGQRLDLLALSIDGYAAATLTYTDAEPVGRSIERLEERSASHPDPFLHAALSIGCAIGAYRRHSFYAALTYVRDLSAGIAYLGSTDLVCCAHGLETLCLGAMDREPRPVAEPDPDRPSVLAFLPLARTIYGSTQKVFDLIREIDPREPVSLLDGVKPSFAARVLASLAVEGASPQANALRELVPDAWVIRDEPEDPEQTPGDGAPSAEPALRLVPEPDAAPLMPRVHLHDRAEPRLYLHMLGCFDALLGDRRLGDDRWRRKASKTLLQVLAVAPGHSASRAKLCEAIWPDRDFLNSRNHLYSVLSATRETLGCKRMRPQYLICEQGKVTLNPKLSECDVDVFERRCREVLTRQGDLPYRLALCRDLTLRYQGGLYVPSQDVRGEFQARRQALESLYVDMLVEAADVALKAGLAKEALWFSNDARERDELREDVMACHFRALAADGRGRELEVAYKHYCSRLSEGLFLAPSARISALHADLARYVQEATTPRDESLQAFEEALGSAA